MSRKEYYAKSRLATGRQPTNKEHLAAVARYASEYGGQIGCETAGWLLGILHDFGKYSERFQLVLEHLCVNVDHAICGAAQLYQIKSQGGKLPAAYAPLIEAINGHHDGLVDISYLTEWFDKIRHGATIETNGKNTPALTGREEMQAAFDCLKRDFPDFQVPVLKRFLPADAGAVESMLHTRMLLSCLVDADYSVSAADEDETYFSSSQQDDLQPADLLPRLAAYRRELQESSTADSAVNRLRDELFERCGEVGATAPAGLFTLTAPTGTGKTLALLHFALRHCAATGQRRIIFVLPFLTLAEQNTRVYRRILPQVLVDHSQSGLADEAREFAARWSVPVIITTSVRFFESLFSDRPTDCRKLHHIANSVVIFDEAQSLPPQLTSCTLQAVNALCERYHCSMVFSTATQPDFSALPQLTWQPREIVAEPEHLYQALRRTQVEWRLRTETPWSALAAEMAQANSACAIVNLRRHALELYQALSAFLTQKEELFFLSTDLCVAHREALVKIISQRLADQLPCRVVATQCIEAGVDFDFDAMYRALAPLDSIIQAAGRCNRNGRLPVGLVSVFIPQTEGSRYPSAWYENAAEIVMRLAFAQYLDIHDPEQIRAYYQALFQDAKDKPELRQALAEFSYQKVAKEYELIAKQGDRVLVPYAGKMELYEALRQQGLSQGVSKGFLHQAAPLTVTTFVKDLATYAEQLNYQGNRDHPGGPSNFYILRPQYQDLYTADRGLQFPATDTAQNNNGIW